jgi:hypothetical protein
VFASNPVIELINTPVPVPSVVLLSAIVGFTNVLQQNPRAIIAALPSLVIIPVVVALVVVTFETAVVT